MSRSLSRRAWLKSAVGGGCLGACGVSAGAAEPTPAPARAPFVYCLNTSTIRGQGLSIVEEVALAARAGYGAIEPWINELERYVQGGGSLRDLAGRIRDAGLRVVSAIGFAEWIVDDEGQRRKGLEAARRDMEMVRQIGGTHIAAPPAGATRAPVLELPRVAERYRALLEVGDKIGVVPQVEVWGFSRNLSRLGEAAYVALECGHARACILADVYHLYKGGSGFAGLRLLDGGAMNAFHVNDYPAKPPRADIGDAHRVHAGDGVAPLGRILRDLHASGFRGALSLELFNWEYWKQDALQVARTGLEKMAAAVRAALA